MVDIDPIVRVISGKGVIEIPEDFRDALDVFLYADLIRNSSNPSINNTWNPDKGFYAHITSCIDNSVISSFDMNFKAQCWQLHSGQASQNLLSLICAYDGILDSFVSVGNVIGVTLSRTNLIKSHPYLTFVPNRIRFECFGEVAIRLTLKGSLLEKCSPSDGTPRKPPPPPPPPPSLFPPTTPVEVSPPYMGDDDGGDTVPFPSDSPPADDFPFGEECVLYRVLFVTIDGNNNEGQLVEIVFGEINNVRVEGTPGNFSIFIECRGNQSTGCIPLQDLQLSSYTGAFIQYNGIELVI